MGVWSLLASQKLERVIIDQHYFNLLSFVLEVWNNLFCVDRLLVSGRSFFPPLSNVQSCNYDILRRNFAEVKRETVNAHIFSLTRIMLSHVASFSWKTNNIFISKVILPLAQWLEIYVSLAFLKRKTLEKGAGLDIWCYGFWYV